MFQACSHTLAHPEVTPCGCFTPPGGADKSWNDAAVHAFVDRALHERADGSVECKFLAGAHGEYFCFESGQPSRRIATWGPLDFRTRLKAEVHHF